MAGSSSTLIEGRVAGPAGIARPASPAPRRGFLRRMHRDDRGLATIEFMLAAPVFLFIVLFVKHANLLSTKKIDTMTEMRNAAFAEANGLFCTSDFKKLIPMPNLVPAILPVGIGPERLTCSSKASNEGGGSPSRTFVWDDVRDTANKNNDFDNDLTRDLRSQKPMLVTASATRVYKFGARENLKPFRWGDTFTVGDATLFASTNDTTRRGYDPVLRDEIRGVSPGAGDLFDGIFPGAR